MKRRKGALSHLDELPERAGDLLASIDEAGELGTPSCGLKRPMLVAKLAKLARSQATRGHDVLLQKPMGDMPRGFTSRTGHHQRGAAPRVAKILAPLSAKVSPIAP